MKRKQAILMPMWKLPRPLPNMAGKKYPSMAQSRWKEMMATPCRLMGGL